MVTEAALSHTTTAVFVDLSSAEWTAIWLSLKIATTATLISVPFGVFTGHRQLNDCRSHYEREVRLRDHAAPTPAAVISRQTAIASAR